MFFDIASNNMYHSELKVIRVIALRVLFLLDCRRVSAISDFVTPIQFQSSPLLVSIQKLLLGVLYMVFKWLPQGIHHPDAA